MMMELNVRFSIDVAPHNFVGDSVLGPKMLVICNTKTTAINISTTDKLTSILLDAVRRFENFQNAVITRRLPKIVPIVRIAYKEVKMTFALVGGPSAKLSETPVVFIL